MTKPTRTTSRNGKAAAAGRGAETYDRILAKLTSVAIDAGARISVDALSRELEVSQTPIREALGRLEADGLVVKHHLRGYRATPLLSRDEVAAMFDLRLLLEPFATARAAERHTPEQLAELTDIERELERPTRGRRQRADYGQFATLDARFHELVAFAGGNMLIHDALERLHVHLHIFRLRRDNTVVDDAIIEHHWILESIGRRDPVVAEAAMRSHIQRSRDRMFQALDTLDTAENTTEADGARRTDG